MITDRLAESSSARFAEADGSPRTVAAGARYDCPKCNTKHPAGPCYNFAKHPLDAKDEKKLTAYLAYLLKRTDAR